MRVYIHENKVVKTVSNDYIASEYFDPSWTHIDSLLDVSAHIVFEDWVVKPYWESNARLSRKAELEAILERTEQEQKELDYILSLSI